MDQGDLVASGSALAPSRSWLTPARALLLMLGAVIVGVGMSLLLGTSPAHAADVDGSGEGLGPLAATSSVAEMTSSVTGSVAHAVITTASTASDQGIPIVKQTVDAAGGSLSAVVPAAATVVTPVVTAVDAALSVMQQVTPSASATLDAITNEVAVAQHRSVLADPVRTTSVGVSGTAVGGISATQNRSGSGGIPPAPILTSGSGAPFGALGLVIGVLALVLIAARRRLYDDALPPSPSFETDTSPA